ncbi:MAG: hypothetical protein RIR00_306, partial [Pseudomonadota bacterium]
RRIKADEKLKTLPVIMQTAASAPEQVRQGLEAGAFYYLTKPYERATLLTIVQAALEDYAKRRQLHEQLLAHINALQFLERGEFAFKTLREATQLATFIAAACPHPENTVLGLSELLVNAVEHGNLGITYDEKAALKRSEQWEHEVERRAALPENRHKQVRLEFQRSSHSITLRITDQGSGFNWKRFLELDPERAFDPNGRGIALARLLSFASVQYEGSGNIVTATVSLNG